MFIEEWKEDRRKRRGRRESVECLFFPHSQLWLPDRRMRKETGDMLERKEVDLLTESHTLLAIENAH